MTDATNFIDWDELKGKEARGVNEDVDLGEVQEIGRNYVVTKKGYADKETFYIPKYLAQRYDGHTLWFNVSEAQKIDFKRTAAPTYEEYERYRVQGAPADIESRVRITEA